MSRVMVKRRGQPRYQVDGIYNEHWFDAEEAGALKYFNLELRDFAVSVTGDSAVSSTDFFPARTVIYAYSIVVATTIVQASDNFDIGFEGTVDAFVDGQSTKTAGTIYDTTQCPDPLPILVPTEADFSVTANTTDITAGTIHATFWCFTTSTPTVV